MKTNLIQTFVTQAIQEHPEAAAREVLEIIGHYLTDNTRLNRVYQAAKALIDQIDKGSLGLNRHNAEVNLRRAVKEAVNLYEELVTALDAMRAYAIPGMNWTDEVGQALLDLADKALAKVKGE